MDLLDAPYVRDIKAGLKSGVYGCSFRFQVVREELNTKPIRSEFNPEGIPERVIYEAKVREFGPVTFPAYDAATAGMRSRGALPARTSRLPMPSTRSDASIQALQRARQPWRLPRRPRGRGQL